MPRVLCLLLLCIPFLIATAVPAQENAATVQGTLQNAAGAPVPDATVHLSGASGEVTATSDSEGKFQFSELAAGEYQLRVNSGGRTIQFAHPVTVSAGPQSISLTITEQGLTLSAGPQEQAGSEKLTSQKVNELPLNKRDFSALLLMAAGTMTDANGATNFTAQFAINGQRGVEAVFAMDGADISDPEMGGSTFSNFNVDAVQEIQSSSGWMPAQIGQGASGFTNIITRSGSSGFHGSFFEFLRNSALDARNYFDHATPETPGRIPPFQRNEFGFTNGGPVVLPHIYDGRGKTFYFGQYQGFRQVLGTTQVFPVPTQLERMGYDATAYPGDVLIVPVDPSIASILARYPLPNLPTGSYGVHTYAASSKVDTDADQFSIRLDHKLSEKNQLFGRFNLNNITGPTTNPDQTAIDPLFGVTYIDRQRNVVFTFTRTESPNFSWQTSFSITRSTPSFPTEDYTDPAVKFNDALFEGFNTAGGSVMSAFGNLFQLQQGFAINKGSHTIAAGGEVRLNRDSTFFGTSPNGEYDFGGGTAYALSDIPSQSGMHNISSGDPLPDTLSSFLSGSPFVYTRAIAPPYFSNGPHIGPAAINRNMGAVYAQDTWKISDRWALDYGLRWEIYTPISERAKRTSSFLNYGADQEFAINPQPGYKTNLDGFMPRVQLTWKATDKLRVHAGGGLTVIPPNIWQDNFLTGSTPFVVYPRLTAAKGAPIQYGFQITPSQLPNVYTPAGTEIFPAHDTKDVPANTVMDVDRYQKDVAALTPSGVISPLNLSAIDPSFGNAWLYTWTMGLEREFGKLTADIGYVGTAAAHLPRTSFPNAYPGASAEFAPHTQFDSSGNVIGGFGVENVITGTSHSSYNALQTSLTGNFPHGGPGVQASYTWSKSLDDTSQVVGGTGSTGAQAIPFPQNPYNTHAEKGPSNFDVTNAFTISAAQNLPVDSINFLQSVSKKITAGWEMLVISTITSGSPFTVYSGVQQTGAGSNGVDRPDQIGTPDLSTARMRREDYFGLGADNDSFFSIPINLPGGTGPNTGYFGSLARNSFRGPAYYDYDFSFIKDTPFGQRKSGIELFDMQFRAEFFNLFNIVNMGLPANTIKGSGFGLISKTAGNSRQIQFSLKLIY
ncbi:MAG TPA: TonB-dependent receptor [Silvibacterium sp.]|nr:TonB-dependent receptor [Silvibacterium sp.]